MTRGAAKRQARGTPAAHRQRGRRLGPALALAAAAGLVGLLYVLAGRTGGGAPIDGAPIATLRTADFHALAFSPSEPQVLFFGHHHGILRSDDGGRTWRPLVERRNFDAMGLAAAPGASPRLYLAGHDVFQVSTDGGSSWRPVAHDLPGTDIHGFAMSPDDPQRLYAFVVGHGVFVSADGGRAWERLDSGLPGDVTALAAAGGSPETLYAGGMRSGLLRSADGGRTWSPVRAGLGTRGVMALAVDPTTRQTVYAGVDGGLYKSTDGSTTWSRLSFPGDNVVALAVSPAQPSVIVALTVRDGQGLVFRSEDGGITWGARP